MVNGWRFTRCPARRPWRPGARPLRVRARSASARSSARCSSNIVTASSRGGRDPLWITRPFLPAASPPIPPPANRPAAGCARSRSRRRLASVPRGRNPATVASLPLHSHARPSTAPPLLPGRRRPGTRRPAVASAASGAAQHPCPAAISGRQTRPKPQSRPVERPQLGTPGHDSGDRSVADAGPKLGDARS